MTAERVVTFVHSDICGSTKLLRRLGRHYDDVLALYRTALRNIAADRAGREVDVVGDAILFVFDDPDDAVKAAMLMRAAASTIGLTLKIAIHTGQVWSNRRRYTGLALHKVARIAGVASSGQLLVSRETLDALRAAGRFAAQPIATALKDFDDGVVFELAIRVA
jgi:class 3 adenylate cyclase